MAISRASRFDIIAKLGEGGMGIVYEAYDREREMKVAVKTMRQLEATTLYHFKREFRAISDLSHPNIIALYELVADDNDCYFTMEIVHGGDILEYVRTGTQSRKKSDTTHSSEFSTGTLPPNLPLRTDKLDTQSMTDVDRIHGRLSAIGDARTRFSSPLVAPLPYIDDVVDIDRLRDAFGQLAKALYALHQAGLVHRDLKPPNVRVTNRGRVVLMDFGIVATESKNRNKTWASRAAGTPAYMAPEQARGEPASSAADWYAFGVMLYEGLTGHRPYAGNHIQLLRAKMNQPPTPIGRFVRGAPADLHNLCIRLLAKEPGERPSPAAVVRAFTDDEVPRLSRPIHQITEQYVFVGREDDIRALREAYCDARDGHETWMFISGRAGVGKTALVRRFLSRVLGRRRAGSSGDHLEPELGADERTGEWTHMPNANRAGALVLRGRCHERETLTYNMFDGLIDSMSHTLMALSRESLVQVLPEDIDLLARLFPVLRRVRSIDDAIRSVDIEPRDLRFRAARALRALLANLSEEHPIIIHVDDMHWADRDSLTLLSQLCAAHGDEKRPARLLILATLRTTDIDSDAHQTVTHLAAYAHVQHRILGPLSNDERDDLKHRLSRLVPASHAVPQSVWREAGGSPLLLVELVRYLEENQGTADAASIRLGDVLYRRIARLSEPLRNLLAVVCVAIEPMPLRVLADAVELDADPAEKALTYLRGRNLIQVQIPGPEYLLTPYHPRVREAVVSRFSDDHLQTLHLAIATRLSTWERASLGAIAHHWRAANRDDKARTYLLEAAELAHGKLAFDRAADLYRQVIDLTPHESVTTDHRSSADRLDLTRRLGNALQLAGRLYEAATLYEQAAGLVQNSGLDSELAIELKRLSAENWLRSGHVERGTQVLADVLNALGARYPRSRGNALFTLVLRRIQQAVRGLKYRKRDVDELSNRALARLDILYAAASTLGFIDHLRGAAMQTYHLAQALRLGEERRICRAFAVEAAYLSSRPGGRKAALELGDDTLKLARRLDDMYLIGVTQMLRGGLMFFSGEASRAIEILRESEQSMSQAHEAVEWERVTGRYLLSLSQVAVGDFAGAARTANRYTAEAERRNDVYARSLFMGIPTTWWLLCQNRPDAAERNLSTLLRGWPEDTYYVAHYIDAYARILVHLYRGKGQEAIDLVAATRPGLSRLMLDRVPWIFGEIHTLEARAALLVGRPQLARKRLRTIRSPRLAYTDAVATLISAALCYQRGDVDDALSKLKTASSTFQEWRARHMSAACDIRRGRLLESNEGRALVERGMSVLSTCGIEAPGLMLDVLAPGFTPVGS